MPFKHYASEHFSFSTARRVHGDAFPYRTFEEFFAAMGPRPKGKQLVTIAGKCYWETRSNTSAENFWRRVDKNGPVPEHCPEIGNCWVWLAAKRTNGYGWVRWGNISTTAHRVAWMLTHGKWAEPQACHKCDNRACCRPEHMFEGTAKDNALDMVSKDRQTKVRGEQCASAKLKESDVIWIRQQLANGAESPTLARQLGVDPKTVYRIEWGEGWKHVTTEDTNQL